MMSGGRARLKAAAIPVAKALEDLDVGVSSVSAASQPA
jgi:hypothetical protein